MKSAIFSVLLSIATALLMRGPAPTTTPPPAPPPPTCVAPAAAQQGPTEAIPGRVVEALRDTFPAWLAGQDIPVAAVAVVGRDGTLWHEEYGVTARGGDVPITAQTIFSIQSMSKSFTALAVLTAVEDGLLALDTPIVAYLPRFTVNSRYEEHRERKMTLRHLVAHRAGFTHEAPLGNNMELDPQPHTFAQHVASISDTWLRYPVGYQQAYSNLGIDLAGYILQERTGVRFEDYMKERVLEPLGMTGSTFDMALIEATADRALGHVAGVDEIPGGIPVVIPMMPAGGLYTNTRDMARYIRFNLNDGELDGRRLLGDELLQEMYTVQFPEKGQRTGYGFEFVCEMIASTYNIYHGGAGYGFASGMMIYPELGFGVVFLTNSFGHRVGHYQVRQVIDAVVVGALGATQAVRAHVSTDGFVPIGAEHERVKEILGYYHRGNRVWIRDGVAGISTNRENFYPLTLLLDGDDLVGRYGWLQEIRFLPLLPDGPGSMVKMNRVIDNAHYFEYLQPNPEDDVPGPNKPEWQAYLGDYVFGQWGRYIGSLAISIRNGYLYADTYRCKEYLPGLFFTYHGEALDFRSDQPTYRNMKFMRRPG
jgi:CubicO group peptidase (beta-lactamase class C family)